MFRPRTRVATAAASAVVLAATVCTREKSPRIPTLEYTVRVDDLASRRLHVTLRTSGITGDSLLLHGVPVYMDNPTAAAVDSAVRDLRATNKSGKRLRVAPVATDDGHPAWWITGGRDPVISYTLQVDFKDSAQTKRYSILIPYVSPERGWLYGNTTFCFPQLASDVRTTASREARITVVFEHPDVPLVALADTTDLHNVYQLMSLQFGLGRFVTEAGTANGVDFEIVYRDSSEFSPRERALLFERTREMMEFETQYFGGAPFERLAFLYFRNASGGGLEGSNACQIYAADGLDLTDFTNPKTRRFYAIAVHELFHTWNPVYVTATEDPWIKEGVSCYGDRILAARLGYQTPEDIAESWNKYYEQFDSNATMRSVALTDPQLWAREYDGEEWRLITYERGMVTALLLDVHIREATDNAKSLDDVLAGLYARHVHRGYDHAQLIETTEAVTGVDVSDFFARYVDAASAPSREEVSTAFARAVELGVFD
jgi:predicted metalloprotease with PDZ domain